MCDCDKKGKKATKAMNPKPAAKKPKKKGK